jgi:NADH-quinone oxidoreductase subunit N
VALWQVYPVHTVVAFHEQWVMDGFAQTAKLFIVILMLLTFIYSRDYIKSQNIAAGEFHLLGLFSALGMLVLTSANSLLMIYLGLELLSLPLYTLVALKRDSVICAEAGMKYFIMGALASGMLLYGMSILYGITGHLVLGDISLALQQTQGVTQVMAGFALVFIIVGLAFKLGAVPFHMWLPDIYAGSPTAVTLLIGTAPKVAAFAMAYRLLAQGLPELAGTWIDFLIVLAALSLLLGNIVAIAQVNLKRMLGYAAIAQVGFILLGLIAGPDAGYLSALFYTLIYTLIAAAGFGGILILSSRGMEVEKIEDLRGLSHHHPWLAFLMLLVMFSFAGVPPTIGFYAKFLVLNALVEAQLTWLAVLAVLASIIGAFYYLRVVKVMYFDSPEHVLPIVEDSFDARILLSVNGLMVLALGIFPGPMYILCQRLFSFGI